MDRLKKRTASFSSELRFGRRGNPQAAPMTGEKSGRNLAMPLLNRPPWMDFAMHDSPSMAD